MPGLLRGVARTAVIAGTATAVSNRVSRRQANRWAQQEEQQHAQEPQYYQQPPPAPARRPQEYHSPAEGASRIEIPGHPHRRRIPSPEGENPGFVTGDPPPPTSPPPPAATPHPPPTSPPPPRTHPGQGEESGARGQQDWRMCQALNRTGQNARLARADHRARRTQRRGENVMADLIAIGYPDEATAEAAAKRHAGWRGT